MAGLNIKLPFHSVFIALAVGIVAWLIGLGGFGALTKKCNDVPGESSSDCAQVYALEWFAIWFELAILLLLPLVALVSVLAKLKPAILTFLAIATVLFINHANFYVSKAYFNEKALKFAKIIDAYRSAAAGSTILLIYNFLLIIYTCWLEGPSSASASAQTRQADVEAGGAGTKKAVHDQPAPPVTATADA